ncbi:MAG: DUF502 domain-containing protein [Hyphomicrobiaceae bacterium]
MREKSASRGGKLPPASPLTAGPVLDANAGPPPPRARLGTRLRNYFLTGLVVVGPVTITLAIAWYVITSFDSWVKPYIPRIYNPDNYLPFALPGAGLVFVIVMLTLVGALAANLLGRSLISAGELMLDRLPIVRNVYKPVKQIFESVVSATGPDQPFQKVAVMEFPSPGIYALVFVTGTASKEIEAVAPGQDLVAVFMPTHLMPPSGFTVFVPRAKVTQIDISVEDAAKIILSAGMVTPDSQARLKQLADAARRERAKKPEPATAA